MSAEFDHGEAREVTPARDGAGAVRDRSGGRTALVIGGGGNGIGGAICRRLAADGYRVAVADIDLSSAESLAGELPPSREHLAIKVDAGDEVSSVRALRTAEEALGGIAVLVYSAGACFVDVTQDQSVAEIDRHVLERNDALNYHGLVFAIRDFVRFRKARPVAHARIIYISSMNGVAPGGLYTGPAYAASKAAATNLVRFAALECGAYGITANAIAPGTILTPPVAEQMTPEKLDSIAQLIPVRKLGRPENIASAVAYFAEPDSDFVTGCVLEINGGRHMG